MSRGVRFTRSAQSDLLEAWLHVAEDNPDAADHLLDKIERDAMALADQPMMGRARPELGEGLRSLQTATPYVLFYISVDEAIVIVRVLHHARDIPNVDF